MAYVADIKRLDDGKILIAGDFQFINGIRKSGIARLNADGSLDNTFNPGGIGLSGYINKMVVQPDGKIVVAGGFTTYNETAAFNVMRINADGSFNANLYPQNTSILLLGVYALAVQIDGKIIIGGSLFNGGGGNPYVLAMRLNPDGTFDNTFNPPQLSQGSNTLALLIQPSGKILIGGTFFTTTAFPRTGIARLNSDGSLDSAGFGGNFNVYSLIRQPDGTVYAGGGTLTKYNSEGVLDTTFNIGAGANGSIRSLAVQADGKLVFGGYFTTYNNLVANRIARANTDGSLDTTFNTGAGFTGPVLALAAQPDGKILAGGGFLDFNNIEKFSLVRLNGTTSSVRAPFDFDGDGKTDISIFRPSVGEWWYRRSIDGGNYAAQFGNSSDKLVPGDYTGDGRADIAVFRPSTGEWFILRSEDGSYYSYPFGTSGDIPSVGDFDGDGKADSAVFRPSDTTWYIRRSSDGGFTIQQFGAAGDVPAVADYDGDGKSDIAIWRVSVGEWWIQKSSNSSVVAFQFGNSSDKPVQGDYTGDGKADVAIYRPSTGEWFILRSEDFSYYSFPFGAGGDIPTPGDYDGDGKADAAVFRPSDTNWYLQRTTAGFTAILFGFPTDKPVPNAFVP